MSNLKKEKQVVDPLTTLFVAVLSSAFVICVAVVLMAVFALQAAAADAGVSLSYLFVKGEQSVGSAHITSGRWRVEAGLIGSGPAGKEFVEEPVKFGSVTHRSFFHANVLGGRLFGDLGVSHVDGHPLVGSFNFKLSAGIKWRRLEISCAHISSAGIYETNNGLNYCGAGATWRF